MRSPAKTDMPTLCNPLEEPLHLPTKETAPKNYNTVAQLAWQNWILLITLMSTPQFIYSSMNTWFLF